MPRPGDKEPMLGPGPMMAVRENDEVFGAAGSSERRRSPASESWLMRIVLLVIIVALVGVGIWAVELQKSLQASTNTLASYDKVIADLRSQLSVTDESVNQTSAQAEDKLKELDSEIRKLWDNVWKRAKVRIDKNEVAITSLKNQQSAFIKTLNAQTEAVKTLDKKLDEFQVSLNVLIAQANIIPKNQADIAAAQKSISSLGSDIEKLRASFKTMALEQTELSVQSGEFEEWIDSFNGYRRQVSQKLYELEQAMQPAAPATPK